MVKEESLVWKKARKKPLVVEFREVKGAQETIRTREGKLLADREADYIIKGTHGELYPIKKEIFKESYEVIEEPAEFCYWQVACGDDFNEEGVRISWTCTAHLHEARARECPYSSLKEARTEGCMDAKNPVREHG